MATLESQSEEPHASEIPGEGVGPSIVKRLCELLDASLELETSPGKGSTFQVILPRYYAVGGKKQVPVSARIHRKSWELAKRK